MRFEICPRRTTQRNKKRCEIGVVTVVDGLFGWLVGWRVLKNFQYVGDTPQEVGEEKEEEEQYRNREGGSWTSVPLSIPHCLPKTSNRRWMGLRRSASGSECTEPISLVTKGEQ